MEELTVAVRSRNLFRRTSPEFPTAWSWFSPESFVRRRSNWTEYEDFEPAIVANSSIWPRRRTTTTMNESRINEKIGERKYLRGISIFIFVLLVENRGISSVCWWDSVIFFSRKCEKVKVNGVSVESWESESEVMEIRRVSVRASWAPFLWLNTLL